MFGIFKKKSEEEKLKDLYKKLTQEAFELSKIDRKASDHKTMEAEEVMKQLESLNRT